MLGENQETLVDSGDAWFPVYGQFQPSYMPKGTVERTSVPSFDPPKGEIKDNNRKPVPSEERNSEQEKQYKDGLPWSKD